ncbi:malate:quinone oxidoreductase, partial [Mycobacterium tuberculosis]|nr:malate:quinone oxidoreductase [Mycobacterium tuberculosis]
TDPLFADMEYSEDAEEIAAWAPLTMEGRGPDGSVAASRVRRGTDVDFGALTRALTSVITAEGGGEVLTGHTVTGLSRDGDGWMVTGTIGET